MFLGCYRLVEDRDVFGEVVLLGVFRDNFFLVFIRIFFIIGVFERGKSL